MYVILVVRHSVFRKPDHFNVRFRVDTLFFVSNDLLYSMAFVQFVQQRVNFYSLIISCVFISLGHALYFQLDVALLGIFVFMGLLRGPIVLGPVWEVGWRHNSSSGLYVVIYDSE